MGITDGILEVIGTVFGILALIDVIAVVVIMLSYWSGLVSGNAIILGVVILAFVNILISAIISEAIQAIIEGFVTAVGAVTEALMGIFSR